MPLSECRNIRSRILPAFALMISLVGLSCTGCKREISAGSKGEAKVLAFDFGVIRPDSEASHTFVATNTSDTRWTIRDIKTSCICTVADVSTPVVEPGDELRVEVVYMAPGRVVDDLRQLLVRFREPDAPALRLQVSAKMRRPVSVIPENVIVPDLTPGECRDFPVTVENYTKPWDGLRIGDAPTWVKTTVVDFQKMDSWEAEDDSVLSSGQQIRLMLEFDSQHLDEGFSSGTIRLVPEIGGKPVPLEKPLLVPVSATLRHPIQVTPSELFVESVQPGTDIVRPISLQALQKTLSLESPRVSVSPGDGLLSAQPVQVDGKTSLEVRFSPGQAEGLVQRTITVEFPDHPGLAIRIPFTAMVKK